MCGIKGCTLSTTRFISSTQFVVFVVERFEADGNKNNASTELSRYLETYKPKSFTDKQKYTSIHKKCEL